MNNPRPRAAQVRNDPGDHHGNLGRLVGLMAPSETLMTTNSGGNVPEIVVAKTRRPSTSQIAGRRTPSSRTPTMLRTPILTPLQIPSPNAHSAEPSPTISPKEDKSFVINVECPSDGE